MSAAPSGRRRGRLLVLVGGGAIVLTLLGIALVPSGGEDTTVPDGGTADAAEPLEEPVDVAVDADGRVLVALTGSSQIVAVEGGRVEVIAGGPTGCASKEAGDGGPGDPAVLCRPTQIAIDADGAVLVADSGHHTVRRIDVTGTISEVVGAVPGLVGVLHADGTIWTSDADAGTLLRGLGTPSVVVDGLGEPRGLAADADGLVHLADASGRVVRVVGGEIETVLGEARPGETAAVDDPSNPIVAPADVTFDSRGRLFVADPGSGTVRMRELAAALVVVPGPFVRPEGLGADRDGNVYVADPGTASVYRIAADLTVTTVAGPG